MQSILEQITDWLKSMIISGIMGNLSGMFDSINQQVGQIAAMWEPHRRTFHLRFFL